MLYFSSHPFRTLSDCSVGDAAALLEVHPVMSGINQICCRLMINFEEKHTDKILNTQTSHDLFTFIFINFSICSLTLKKSTSFITCF